MTQVSWVRQLALAVVLFLLGSFAYWMEYQHKPKKEKEVEQNKKVFQLSSLPVKSIQITQGDQSIELNCLDFSAQLCKPEDQSKWELAQPIKVKADDSNVNSLLSAANHINASEIIDLSTETAEKRAELLKEYGLDAASRASQPPRRFTIETEKGKWTLHLGLAHPIGEGIFALLEQPGTSETNRVYLIPSYFKANFEHELNHWRNKKLLTLASHEIETFSLESKKAGKIQGIRKDGNWTLKAQGKEQAGDIENIDSLLAGATVLSAKSFASENNGNPKAASILKGMQNILTLTLTKPQGAEKQAPTPIVLKLFAKAGSPNSKDSIYATVSNVDPLFELEPNAKDRLDQGMKDLRLAKLITSMERFSAKKLSFSGKPLGSEPVVLVNTDGKWVIEKTKADVQPEKVQTLLEKLSGNRIQDFISSSAAKGSPKEGIELTLSDEKNDAKRRFVFWKNEGKLYAQDLLKVSHGKPEEVLVVDSSIQDGLPWAADFFKKSP